MKIMDTKKEVKFADSNSIEPSKVHVNLAFEHEDDQMPKINKSKRNTVFLLDPLSLLNRRKSSAKHNELFMASRSRRLSKSNHSSNLTESEVKEILADFVNEKNFCCSASFLKSMKIIDLNSSSIYGYSLETYYEKRTLNLIAKQKLDEKEERLVNNATISEAYSSILRQAESQKWSVKLHTDFDFKNDCKVVKEIPLHCFKSFHVCALKSKKLDDGQIEAAFNSIDSSRTSTNDAELCECMTSNLDEEFLLRLSIDFKSRNDSFFSSTDKLPMNLLVKSTYLPIFVEEKENLSEIIDFYDEEIKIASKDLIELSQKEVDPSNCRIKVQRHKIVAIPITECVLNYQNKESMFKIYGLEKKVHFPTYSRTFLCNLI